MARFELLFKKSVSKDLRGIPNEHVPSILERIETLKENPRPPGSLKLSGQEKYRLRLGVYRILYEILEEERTIKVVKVGHRGDIYRD